MTIDNRLERCSVIKLLPKFYASLSNGQSRIPEVKYLKEKNTTAPRAKSRRVPRTDPTTTVEELDNSSAQTMVQLKTSKYSITIQYMLR